jgi:hypothetical protein
VPEDDDRSGRRNGVLRSLAILSARKRGGPRRDRLSFHPELLTGVRLISEVTGETYAGVTSAAEDAQPASTVSNATIPRFLM